MMMELLILIIAGIAGTALGLFFGTYAGVLISENRWEGRTLTRTEKAYLISLPILLILALIYLLTL